MAELEPVNRDIFELAQQLNQRFGAFEDNFSKRMDRLEISVMKEIDTLKLGYDREVESNIKCLGDLEGVIDGDMGEPGLKERLVKVETVTGWQWVALTASFGFTTLVLSFLISHVGGI